MRNARFLKTTRLRVQAHARLDNTFASTEGSTRDGRSDRAHVFGARTVRPASNRVLYRLAFAQILEGDVAHLRAVEEEVAAIGLNKAKASLRHHLFDYALLAAVDGGKRRPRDWPDRDCTRATRSIFALKIDLSSDPKLLKADVRNRRAMKEQVFAIALNKPKSLVFDNLLHDTTRHFCHLPGGIPTGCRHKAKQGLAAWQAVEHVARLRKGLATRHYVTMFFPYRGEDYKRERNFFFVNFSGDR
jgi:hypothetical protein